MNDAGLTVLVVDPSRARGAVVEEGLRSAGVERIVMIADADDLQPRLASLDPDIIVIDVEGPSRDFLEQMFEVSRTAARPVAMFVDHADAAMMHAAIDAGVSAYVVDGLKPERVKPIVDIAILRFNAFARLQQELAEARTELADRKTIERAKGILMKARGVDEGEAYGLMRRKAMNEGRKLAEIAGAIITAAEIMG